MSKPAVKIEKVVHQLRRSTSRLPDPSVTLVGKRWKNPFLVLISCILSLRTQDRTTLPAAERLFALADTVQAMLKLSTDQIEKAIFPVGFYRTKARTILRICRDLMDRFAGQVPDDLDTLLSLHGVGRKTANLVLIEGFGKPGICVDTHVHRISNRIGFVKTKSPLETEMVLRKKLPKSFWNEYNSLLVLWGQNVCKPISPLCSRCCLKAMCPKIGVTRRR